MTTSTTAAHRPTVRSRPRAVEEPRASVLARPLVPYLLILGSGLLLVVLGLVMVLSASSVRAYSTSGSSFTYFQRQLMWVGIGLPVLGLGMALPPKAFRVLGHVLLLTSLALLVVVLLPGVGSSAYGATRWIQVGPVRAQPSELAKLALVLWGADLFARKQRLLGQPKHLVVPFVPVATLCAVLVILEPDLGTTVVVLTVMFALLFVAGAGTGLLAKLFAGFAGVAALIVANRPYMFDRVTSFLHPSADPLSGGWQAVQGLYALASGGWFGVGLGASRQKWLYLPNAHTDYVFAIIGEELGLLGTLVVVCLFAVLGYAGVCVARRTRDPFCRLAAAGATAWLVGQALVNMGAVAGLLPITGIPLPLISFGGSSLLPSMFAIGMLASFARREPAAAAALARRPRRRAR
ncbi:MAG: putative lipid II flippase FtsW [Mycobacteriales bacterium]|nr:putative lipid II flippase FtsW [Frankia sp.]